jgi:hypothetical protein
VQLVAAAMVAARATAMYARRSFIAKKAVCGLWSLWSY